MSFLTLEQIKELKSSEFNSKTLEIKQALFDLRFKQATKKNIKTHLIKKYKKMLAQLLTIQGQLNK